MSLLCICLQMTVEIKLHFYLGITDTFYQVGNLPMQKLQVPRPTCTCTGKRVPNGIWGVKVPAGESIKGHAQG